MCPSSSSKATGDPEGTRLPVRVIFAALGTRRVLIPRNFGLVKEEQACSINQKSRDRARLPSYGPGIIYIKKDAIRQELDAFCSDQNKAESSGERSDTSS
jgi:hypothetical protein